MSTEHPPFHLAIDGPVAAGKGTVSRLAAERLNFFYVDTGAMYRVTALLAERNDVPLSDQKRVAELVREAEIELREPQDGEKDGRLITVIVDGEDVSWAIRTESISQGSSKVAALADVRKVLVEKQRQIAARRNVVMEGRDIATVVLPHAQLKVFLTASDEERAKRRQFQLQQKGQNITLEEVYRDLLERDKRDREREVDPLVEAPDAWRIDSTNLDIDEVVDLIVGRVKAMME